MSNQPTMKSVFDRMRLDSDFRDEVRAAIARWKEPLLAAADWEDPVEEVASLATSHQRTLFVFVFDEGDVAAFLTIEPSTVAPSGTDEGALPIDPKAPVGMLIEAIKSNRYARVVVRQAIHTPADGIETSRLELA